MQCATCTAVHSGPNESATKILLSHVTDEEAITCLRGSSSGLYGFKATWSTLRGLKKSGRNTGCIHACVQRWGCLYRNILNTCHQRAWGGRRNPVAEAPGVGFSGEGS